MNITPKLLQRTTKTPIKKVNFIKKSQNTKNINTDNKNNFLLIITNEFNKLDEEEIKSSFNSVFKNQNNEQTTFITSLLLKIQDVKKSILDKIKDNNNKKNINNNNLSFSKEINNDKINNIQNELKSLIKNSKIKFKQFYDCLTSSVNNSLNQLSDYITQDKKNLAIEKLNNFDKIINDLSSIVSNIENIQSKKSIIKFK